MADYKVTARSRAVSRLLQGICGDRTHVLVVLSDDPGGQTWSAEMFGDFGPIDAENAATALIDLLANHIDPDTGCLGCKARLERARAALEILRAPPPEGAVH